MGWGGGEGSSGDRVRGLASPLTFEPFHGGKGFDVDKFHVLEGDWHAQEVFQKGKREVRVYRLPREQSPSKEPSNGKKALV